jgi:hypothetical protein
MTHDQIQALLGDPHTVNVLGIAAIVAAATLLASLYILAYFQILSYALYMVPYVLLVAFCGIWALRDHAGEAGVLLVFGALALCWAIYPPGYPHERVLSNEEYDDEDMEPVEGADGSAGPRGRPGWAKSRPAKPVSPTPPIELVP